jgi:phage shock protein C
MYCCNCGRELEDEARFCSACGTARPPVRPPSGDDRIPLSRVRAGRKIAGVCGGVARYFDLDVTLVRVLWIILTIFLAGLPGVVAYIVCWIAMPQDPPYFSAPASPEGATTFSSSVDSPT